MKKLILFTLLSVFSFACSDDKDDTSCWEFYVEDENIAYVTESLQAQYSGTGKYTEKELDEMIQSLLSSTYCGLTEPQAKTAISNLNKIMKDSYDDGSIWCWVVYTYREK